MENTNGNNDNQYNSNCLFINRLMTWYHPNYYKKLRANRQQATSLESSGNGREGHEPSSGGREGPQVSSAKLKNKIVDSRSQVGYSGTRVGAGDTPSIGTGDAPLKGPLNASRRDPESQCGDKMSGGTVTRSSQGYGPSNSLRVTSTQAVKREGGPASDQASSGSRINKR